jgi:peptidoglycan hydrolase CwlO-like protein
MRNWNDQIKDDAVRTALLRPLLPLLVGSRSTEEVELRRSYLALDWLARECAPAWLSLRDDLKAHAVALRGLAPLTDTTSCKAAQQTLEAARDAAWAAARAAAREAAWEAARAAARDAARAAAWAALAPTVTALQASASDLVRRMVSVK